MANQGSSPQADLYHGQIVMAIQFRVQPSTQMALLALDWELVVGAVEWNFKSMGRMKIGLGPASTIAMGNVVEGETVTRHRMARWFSTFARFVK